MTYKTSYTKEEVEELVNWFDTHTYEHEVDLGHGIRVCDITVTLDQMKNIALTQYENRTFSGQIQMLFRIRDELIKQGKVHES